MDKIKQIQTAVEDIREVLIDTGYAEAECMPLSDLDDTVKEAINDRLYNNIKIVGSSSSEQPSLPTAQGLNTTTGKLEDLDVMWAEDYFGSNVPKTYTLNHNTAESEGKGMSFATFNSAGRIISDGTIPVNLVGVPGRDGINGTNGKDAIQREQLFILGNLTEKPSRPVSINEDGHIPVDFELNKYWTVFPSGVSDDDPVEYIIQRVKNPGEAWGEGSEPAIGAQFGKIGRDGNGIEYIFCLTSSETAPDVPNSDPNLNEDSIEFPLYSPNGYKGTDDPESVSKEKSICWASKRVQKYVSEEGLNTQQGGLYSPPVIWAKYTTDGIDGGGRTVMAYCLAPYNSSLQPPHGGNGDPITNTATAPISDDGTKGFITPPTVKDGKGVGMSCASFDSNGNILQNGGSVPICITGSNGVNGADGTNVQFIYRLVPDMTNFNALKDFYSNENTPSLESVQSEGSKEYIPSKTDISPSTDQILSGGLSVQNGTGIDSKAHYTICDTDWTDEPSGINLDNKVECVCTRQKIKGNDGIEYGSEGSVPVPWAIWGEDGIDGSSVEYIFLVTPEYINIDGQEIKITWEQDNNGYYICSDPNYKLPTIKEYEAYDKDNNTNYASDFKINEEWIPGISDKNIFNTHEGTDEPQDVDVNQPVEGVAIRKKKYNTETGKLDEYGGDFSKPAQWAHGSSDGASFITAYAFARTTEDLGNYLKANPPKGGSYKDTPIVPDDSIFYNGSTNITIKWSDTVPEGGDTTPIWMTMRVFKSNEEIGSEHDLVWSVPSKMSDRTDFQVEFCPAYIDENGIKQESIKPTPTNFTSFYNDALATENKSPLDVAEENGRNAEKANNGYWGDSANDTVWMATCYYRGGKGTDWQVVKVKGEKGDAGVSVTIQGTAILKECDEFNDKTLQFVNDVTKKPYNWVLYQCNTNEAIYRGNSENNQYELYNPNNGDGGLIAGNLYVGDGDSFENVGSIKGEQGDGAYLYMAFSDDPSVLEDNNEDAMISTDASKPLKYIGYRAETYPLNKDALSKASTYTGWLGKGEDGGGQEQIFVLSKHVEGKLTGDEGPEVPTSLEDGSDKVPEFRPEISDDNLSGEDGKWSDKPLTPNKDYPYCGVVTRYTSDGIGRGPAALYSRYIADAIDAIYLELSEDQVSVPLNVDGSIDINDSTENDEVFDVVARLFYGDDELTIDDGVKYEYSFDDETYYNNENSLFNITKTQLENKPSFLYIKVSYNNVEHIKKVAITYSSNAYEMTLSKSILYKDLSTGYLFSDYDEISVYLKKWNGKDGTNVLQSEIELTWGDVAGNQNSSSYSVSNGTCEVNGLSKLSNIAKIRIAVKQNYKEICFEEVGVIANGEDGQSQEYVYRSYTEEQSEFNELTPMNGDQIGYDATVNDKKYSDPEYIPEDWSDNPISTSEAEPFVYVAVRKKINGKWQKFSTPVLWAKGSKDGDDATNIDVKLSSNEGVYVLNNNTLNVPKIELIASAYENDNKISIDISYNTPEITLSRVFKDGVYVELSDYYPGTFDVDTDDYESAKIKLTRNEDISITEPCVYTYEFSIYVKEVEYLVSYNIRIMQGGGENALYLELDNDQETVIKQNGVYIFDPISTQATLYNGSVAEPSTYNAVFNDCTGKCDKGTITITEIDNDNAYVTITGTSDSLGISRSKTFKINVVESPDVYRIVTDKTVINRDDNNDNKQVTVNISKNGEILNDGDQLSVTYLDAENKSETLTTENNKINITNDLTGTIITLKKDSLLLDQETVGVVGNGKGAAYYEIKANVESVSINKSTNDVVSVYPIVKYLEDVDTYNQWIVDSSDAYGKFKQDPGKKIYYSIDDQSVIEFKDVVELDSSNTKITFYLSSSDSNSPSESDPQYTVQITIVENGAPGAPGAPGGQGPKGSSAPVIYPAGEYTPEVTYTGNAQKAPYVYVTDDSTIKYYIAFGTPETDPNESNTIDSNTSLDWDKPTDKWIKMESYSAIYSDIGMFNHALVGKGVFHGNYMFSQDGVCTDTRSEYYNKLMNYSEALDQGTGKLPQLIEETSGIPNICFNAVTGEGGFAGKNIMFNEDGSGGIGTSGKKLFVGDENGAFLQNGTVRTEIDKSVADTPANVELGWYDKVYYMYQPIVPTGAAESDTYFKTINLPTALTAPEKSGYLGTIVLCNQSTKDFQIALVISESKSITMVIPQLRCVSVEYFVEVNDDGTYKIYPLLPIGPQYITAA